MRRSVRTKLAGQQLGKAFVNFGDAVRKLPAEVVAK
jgi:hypothetical protein